MQVALLGERVQIPTPFVAPPQWHLATPEDVARHSRVRVVDRIYSPRANPNIDGVDYYSGIQDGEAVLLYVGVEKNFEEHIPIADLTNPCGSKVYLVQER